MDETSRLRAQWKTDSAKWSMGLQITIRRLQCVCVYIYVTVTSGHECVPHHRNGRLLLGTVNSHPGIRYHQVKDWKYDHLDHNTVFFNHVHTEVVSKTAIKGTRRKQEL